MLLKSSLLASPARAASASVAFPATEMSKVKVIKPEKATQGQDGGVSMYIHRRAPTTISGNGTFLCVDIQP